MPIRAINKSTVYSEPRFSCACRKIIISLKTASRDRIFYRFGGFGQIQIPFFMLVAFFQECENCTIQQYNVLMQVMIQIRHGTFLLRMKYLSYKLKPY